MTISFVAYVTHLLFTISTAQDPPCNILLRSILNTNVEIIIPKTVSTAQHVYKLCEHLASPDVTLARRTTVSLDRERGLNKKNAGTMLWPLNKSSMNAPEGCLPLLYFVYGNKKRPK